MRRFLIVTAAVVAAVIFFVLATLPPQPLAVDVSGADARLRQRTVTGAYHVHSTRSDGAEGTASIARAARQAGLAFLIVTDHGDGTRPPDPPAYIDSVLCIDGVEISTNGGHYVALDMPAAPYPLGGDAATVVEDVGRLGGFGIAAHPDSLKRELAWTDWQAPIDGIEWLSVDSEWRDEPKPRLARALLDYFVRPAPAMASILDRPVVTLRRWDTLIKDRPVVALAAVDAHGGVRSREEGSAPLGVGPSYETSFRTIGNRVLLERPFSGDAAADARLLMAAIRAGRVYSVVDAIASPALFDFGSPSPQWSLPREARIQQVPAGDSIRYEVHVEGAPGTPPVPWVLTNPLVLPARAFGAAGSVPAGGVVVDGNWHLQKDAASDGEVRIADDRSVTVGYRLAPGPKGNQFVALAVDIVSAVVEQIAVEAEASGPMRLSVQLKFPGGDERWVKSVYVDANRRTVVVPVSQMVRSDRQPRPMPPTTAATSLLFVSDLTNAAPGSERTFTLRNVRFIR